MTRRFQLVVACLAVVVLPSSAWANWIDTFDGGLQQTWSFVGGTSTTYTAGEVGNVLQMEDATPFVSGGTNYIAGVVNEDFTNVRVSGTVNPNQSAGNPRIGLLARADVGLGNAYGLVIDYTAFSGAPLGNVSIMRFDGFGVTTLSTTTALQSGFDVTDSFFLEFDLYGANFTGRVFDQPGGTLLTSLTTTDSTYANGNSGAFTANFPSRSVFGEFDDVSSIAVPEPSTFALLSAGGLSLIGYCCCRKRRLS